MTQTTSRVVEVARFGRRTLSRPPRGSLRASRTALTSSSQRIKLVRQQPHMKRQARHRAVRSQAAAQQVSMRTLRSKDSMSARHRTRGTRQHPQQSAVSTARRHLAARIVRVPSLFCCSGGGVPHLRACIGSLLYCSSYQLFTARVGAWVGSWNPGSPGSCFPKTAAAKGHSTGGMKGYAWGSNPSPLPPAPPPPPPPPSCSVPLGASGSVVCNQTVFYKSCGMGQASEDAPAKHIETLYQSALLFIIDPI